eukprot:6195022-Pleurochrysis_carterae.AAC.6
MELLYALTGRSSSMTKTRQSPKSAMARTRRNVEGKAASPHAFKHDTRRSGATRVAQGFSIYTYKARCASTSPGGP